MDNLDSANTSTYALLSNVNSQSVFEKFQREEEAIQKCQEAQNLIKLSQIDPYEYYQQLYNQIQNTENIIEYLNYVLIEQPQIQIEEKINSVKQNMKRSGKNIPSHLDLFIREKLERDKKLDVRNNIHAYKRTYLQNRYLKDKRDAVANQLRTQKVEQFLQEQEQFSYFWSKKSIYDDNIKIPLNSMQKNANKYKTFEEQEILFTVKSVKTNPFQIAEDYQNNELDQYQDYLKEHLKEPYQIFINSPEQLISSTKSIKLPIQLNPLIFQKEKGNSQNEIGSQIELLSSRLEQSQATCDILLEQYLKKINESYLINKEINMQLFGEQKFQNEQNNGESNKIKILKKKRAKEEIKYKSKLGWIKDENQILYAYDINDSQMQEYNFNIFDKLLRQYTQVECEIQFFESKKDLNKKAIQQNKQTRQRVSQLLQKNKNIFYIFHHLLLQASLDNILYLFPFAENIYPLYNCNYETDIQQNLLSNYNMTQKPFVNIPLYLQNISTTNKELQNVSEQIPKNKILIAVLRVFKKNDRKNQNIQKKIIIPELNLGRSLNQGTYVENLLNKIKTSNALHSAEDRQIQLQTQKYNGFSNLDKQEQDHFKFDNLQEQFCQIYSAQSSSRSLAFSQSSSKSQQSLSVQKEKNNDSQKQQLQFLPINFKYKTLNQKNSIANEKQTSQTQMINQVQNDYLIQQLIDTIYIANIPRPNSKQKNKEKAQNQIIEQTQQDDQSNLYNEDIIKAASVFKKSSMYTYQLKNINYIILYLQILLLSNLNFLFLENKDRFKFRWLELKQFTLIWYKSAPELKVNQSDGRESIIQKKPNGFGEILIEQVEDSVVGKIFILQIVKKQVISLAKKHSFIVKLVNRNLVIEYDSTRVGLMWSKTIRNVVAQKAYMYYLIKLGSNGKLFKYFNDLDVIELNLSNHTISNKNFTKKNIAIEHKLCVLIFDSITSHQKLQIINLQNSGLSPISIKELFKYLSKPLKKTRINVINLSQNEMDPESVRQLSAYLQSENCQQLQDLVLDDCNLKDNLFQFILDSIKERYKWQMQNYQNPVKAEISEETHWRQVSLRYSNKSNQNSPRKENTYFFQRLSFAGNQITDKGLKKFMKIIEEIQNQAQPIIYKLLFFFTFTKRDLEDFEMIDLDLSRNQFTNELSNFGAFISQRQIFRRLYLDNLNNPIPRQLESFILSFSDNYRTEVLSLRGNPLSIQAYTNLIKVLDENFTIQEIKIDFSTFNQFQQTYSQLDKQSNNLRSQFFSFSLLQTQNN